MSIEIHMSKKLEDSETESKVHIIPFEIEADCVAKTEEYFESTIRTDESGVQTASFRGYPLHGEKIKLPDNYVGVVLQETVKPLTEDDNRKFFATNKFHSFTNWNWDKLPSKDDAIQQALEWINVAEVLHAPVEQKEETQDTPK